MVAHNLNDTYRKGIDDILTPTGSENSNLEFGDSVESRTQHARRPREQGVVSLHSDPVSAVAMGRVLVGIAAGELKDDKRSLGSLGVREQEHENKELDVLTALTLGDAIAAAEFKQTETTEVRNKYGPPGEWNSTSCPTDYKLLSNNTSTTDAELRGSIDGYVLGLHVRELAGNLQNQLTLSRLIRMYYGRGQMRIGSNEVGFCRRSTVLRAHDQEVQKTAETVFIYFCANKKITVTEGILQRFHESFKQYTDYVDRLSESKISGRTKGYNEDFSICKDVDSSIVYYDTPVDLFVVMDVTEQNTRGMQDQIDVIGHLVGYMDIGYGAGSITVLLNSKRQLDLDDISYNETNSACATCKLTRVDFRNYERDTLASVLESLNRTLQRYEEARRFEPAVPAKAVIFFHYDTTIDEDKKSLEEAKRILRYGHRDVHIFTVGTNAEALENIATGSQSTKFTESLTPTKLADRIREEIKKVPATFQYHECAKPRSKVEESNIYHGYVTPKSKQMWAMYPEYFLKSYTIEFKFKADNGKIKVCHARDYSDPSLTVDTTSNNNRCNETGTNGAQEVVFVIRNPCHYYNKDNCRPINFAVEGLQSDVQSAFRSACTDANCRRTDQIKFTVSHKGIACSGALGLLASPLILLAVIYATLKQL